MIREYDVIVIGSGSGAIIVDQALSEGFKVALVDKGPLGGTCLNLGCIPSKVLIFPADRIAEIQEASKLGVEAEIKNIDFNAIMDRMRDIVQDGQNHMREGLKDVEDLDFYEQEGYFVDDYTLEIGEEKIQGEKFFIVAGVRPLIPSIKGLDEVDYLTNESVLEIEERPESIIIVGGGYIAAEYGHFFAAMNTKVTILEMDDRLVADEEPEISELLKSEMEKRMDVFTNTKVVEVKSNQQNITVIGEDTNTGEEKEFTTERVMIAAGRKSNSDLLKVENTGVETDESGFIKVNEYLETSKDNIWALGDIIGKQMFKHVANEEADLVWYNAVHENKAEMNYSAAPHAVYSHPQIASAGLTESEAKKEHDILVGLANYSEVAKGEAMMEDKGFAKIVLERNSGEVLGFHIIGPYAPIVIQEVICVMTMGRDLTPIINTMHIHPALPEIIQRTLQHLHEPES